MRFIAEIIDQHVEDAAFLWLLRDQAVHTANYDLADLADLDERIAAHLDGLRISGQAGWERAFEELEAQGEAGEVFTASVLAFEAKGRVGDTAIEPLLALATASSEVARGLVSALGWLAGERGSGVGRELLSRPDPELRLAGLAALSVCRKDPGLALDRALGEEDLPLRRRALRLVGELGRVSLGSRLGPHLQAADPDCRFWAARSLLLLGHGRAAVAALRQLAEDGGPRAEAATRLACRSLPMAQAGSWLRRLAAKENTQRLAVLGAGASGDPARLPWLIEAMSVPAVAKVAGTAFNLITGLDLAAEGLLGEAPEGISTGPSEDPADNDVGLDPDEDLPMPDPQAARDWWRRNSQSWQPGTWSAGQRLVFGQPANRSHLDAVLRGGWQNQRAVAAFERVLLAPGQPLFEVRAPALAQIRRLAGTGSKQAGGEHGATVSVTGR